MRSRFFCLLIFCALVPATASAAENPLEAHVERPYGAVPYEGPIIDVHTHPKLKKVGDTYFEQARASGIVHSILMGTPNTYRKGNSQDNYPVAIRLEDVSSLCSSDFVGIAGIRKDENRARTDLYRAFEDFESGKCIGFGEVGLSHYDKPRKRTGARKGKQHIVQLRLDHPLIVEMLAFANQHSAPVVFHIEPFYSPEKIDRLTEVMAFYRRICTRYPGAKLIAAHNGMMPPEALEALFRDCPNIYADIKFTHSKGLYWGFSDLHIVSDLDFRLHERWAASMERFPERYLFGSDWKMGKGKSFDDFSGHIAIVRRIVGSLREDVQRMFMFENARGVYVFD